MFDIFKGITGSGGTAPKAESIGTLKLHLAPVDKQKGQIAMSRPITQEQWDAIMAVLSPQ